jgi:PAS domain S-box-containing protein
MSTDRLTPALQDTLGAFEEPCVPLTTAEVADALDLGRRSTYDRLDRLVEHDRLRTKKVGASARVWWQPAGETPAPEESTAAARSLVDDVLDRADVGVIVLDEDDTVVWLNEATERYFDLDRAQVRGRDLREVLTADIAPAVADPEAFTATVRATDGDGDDTEAFECHVTPGANRAERWLEHRSRPIETGAYAGGRVELYDDVTDRKRAEAAHDQDRAQFESLVDAVEEYAIFTLDPAGHVQNWNAGARKIKGYAEGEILGTHVSAFYTPEDRTARVPERNLAAAERQGSIQEEGWRVRADGSTFWASVTISPFYEDGDLAGFVKVTRDLTDQREQRRALRRERNLLDRVLETSPVGVGVFDADGTALRVNREFTEFLEPDEDTPLGYELGDRPLLDEDGDEIPYEERPAPRALATDEPVRGQRIRVEREEGGPRWLSVNAAPFHDGTDGVVVTMADVTQLVEQSRRLERQRDELEAELDDVFARVSDGFFGLDTELRFTYLNERATDLFGRAEEDLLDVHIWDALEPGPVAQRVFEEVLDTQEPATFEEYYEPFEAWFENHVYPSESGLSVYFRDVTERKEREQQLEQYATIVETVDDGVYAVDADARFVLVNDAFCGMTGWDRDELLGSPASLVHDESVTTTAEEAAAAVAAGERDRATIELEVETKAGERVPVETRLQPFPAEGGTGRCGVVRDVTERKEREQQLERYERIVETVTDGIYVLDEAGRFRQVNEAFASLTQFDRADLLDRHAAVVFGENFGALDAEARARFERGETDVATFEEEIFTADGEAVVVESRFRPMTLEGGQGRVGVVRDVTERKRFEETLRGLYDSAHDLVEAESAAAVAGEVVETVRSILDIPAVAVYLFDEETGGLAPAARTLDGGFLQSDLPSVPLDESTITGAVYASGETRRYDDLDESQSVRAADSEMRAGLFVPIGDHGVLVAGSPAEGAFDDRTQRLLELVAANAESGVDRVEREAELARQRDHLGALNDLNGVFRDITEAVIDQSSREEIESTVCERLAAADSYSFAWIGAVDGQRQTVDLRTEAGVEGYLDGITISVDPDDERSVGPTAQAVLTGEMQVTRDVSRGESHEPWRDHVEAHGFRSSAAIPIVHEATLYGVLNVYADRAGAFSDDEQAVVGQLGEVVGHAIAAVERKRALMSDEVVELEYQIDDLFDAVGLDAPTAGRISIDRAIPSGDGTYLLYGRVTEDAREALAGLVEAATHWDRLSVIAEQGSVSRFEIRATEPPVVSAVASRGGYVESATIEDGDYRLQVHLPVGADVRAITDAVTATYPKAALVAQRQVSRPDPGESRILEALYDDLTERQRTALEVAYHAGFFAWPRESDGEAVAESLGVSAPTFHQHLRKAQEKVVAAVLSTPPAAAESS